MRTTTVVIAVALLLGAGIFFLPRVINVVRPGGSALNPTGTAQDRAYAIDEMRTTSGIEWARWNDASSVWLGVADASEAQSAANTACQMLSRRNVRGGISVHAFLIAAYDRGGRQPHAVERC